jgi:hypothetical protein
MVGVIDRLVGVRNLRHGQQSQQNHAHNRRNRIGARPRSQVVRA